LCFRLWRRRDIGFQITHGKLRNALHRFAGAPHVEQYDIPDIARRRIGQLRGEALDAAVVPEHREAFDEEMEQARAVP
jgi:hypothetical protein